MSKILILFGAAGAMLYSWVAIRLVLRLTQGSAATAASKRLPIAMGMGAATFHALVLHSTLMTGHGVDFSFFNAVSLLTWLIAVIVLAAAMYKPVENLGIVILPLAAIGLVLAMVFPHREVVADDAAAGLSVHIVTSVLAFSLLNIAAVQSVLLAIQNRHLRNKHPGGFVRALPPLETMERLLFQIIGLGFVLQTLSLLTGAVFLKDMFAQHMVHKTVLSITAWLVFATLLWGRWRFGWRGRTAIRWSLAGYAVLVLAYFGSKLVLEQILSRHWS